MLTRKAETTRGKAPTQGDEEKPPQLELEEEPGEGDGDGITASLLGLSARRRRGVAWRGMACSSPLHQLATPVLSPDLQTATPLNRWDGKPNVVRPLIWSGRRALDTTTVPALA
jgi:hypothetical protein